MKKFQSTRMFLEIMSVYEPQPFEKLQWLNRKFSFIVIFSIIFSILGIVYFFHVANNLDEYSVSFYGISSTVVTLINVIVFAWKIPVIFNFFDTFANAIQKRIEYPASKFIYDEANTLIEKWTKFIIYLGYFTYVTLMGPNLVDTIFTNYILKTHKDDYAAFVYPVWFPFDWTTSLWGYVIAFWVQFIALFYNYQAAACSIFFLIESCIILNALIKDMRNQLKNLIEMKKNEATTTQLNAVLSTIVENHSITIECIIMLTDIFEINVMACMLRSLLNNCASLLMFQMEWSEGRVDFGVLIGASVKCFWALGPVFAFCEAGERMGTSFNDFAETFNQCEFYLLPIELQRMLPTIMLALQQPPLLQSFGNLPCSRETFKKVAKASFSYFLVIREFF